MIRSSLERALKDSGVDLSKNGLNFSLKGQEQAGRQLHAVPRRAAATSPSTAASKQLPRLLRIHQFGSRRATRASISAFEET